MMAAPKTVVFDFDHTLYHGDSGQHLVHWLLRRSLWRSLAALLAAPIFTPLVMALPTRRLGLSAFVWLGTVATGEAREISALIDAYLAEHAAILRAKLLPAALSVLKQHLAAGDRVIIATGAPPALASRILALAGYGHLPVIGTEVSPWLGGSIIHQHCHFEQKMRMLRAAGHGEIDIAYSDSSADLPLLKAARKPVVVNPRALRVKLFQSVLPEGTPILNWGCPGRAGNLEEAGQNLSG